jgi:DNA-binding XRE family transcriptional regulator
VWNLIFLSLFCKAKRHKRAFIVFPCLILINLLYKIIENMERDDNIGENIKKYRTKQGLSQEDFAQKSGVKYTTLTKIESGFIKKPSVFVMAKTAKALGVNIEELIK